MIYNFTAPSLTLSDFTDTEAFPSAPYDTGDDTAPARYEIFKKIVRDWFDTRVVCDDDNFPRYFQRVIYRDYPRYEQLLRVQPDISKVDWFVQSYREIQRIASSLTSSTESTSGTTTGTHTNENTSSTASGESTSRETSGNEQGTESNAESVQATTGKTGSRNATETGTDKKNLAETNTGNKSGTNEVAKTGTEQKELDIIGSKTGTETKTGSTTGNGSITDGGTDTKNISGATLTRRRGYDTETPSGTETTTEILHEGVQGADKAAPMSATGVTFATGDDGIEQVEVGGAYGGAASALTSRNTQNHNTRSTSFSDRQTQTSYNSDTATEYGTTINSGGAEVSAPYKESTGYGKTETKSESGTQSESGATGEAENRSETERTSFTNRADTTTEEETTSSGRIARETDEHEKNAGEETAEAGSENRLTGQIHGTARQTSGTEGTSTTRTGTTTNAGSGTDEQTTSGSRGTAGRSDTGERTVYTGRDRTPAEIIRDAVSVIEGTSAWIWMSEQLEPCFYGLYEI